MKNLNASPRDLSSVGLFDDPRKLENLLSKNNDGTVRDENMWLIPFTQGDAHHVTVTIRKCVNASLKPFFPQMFRYM
jgi:hypothetical protein